MHHGRAAGGELAPEGGDAMNFSMLRTRDSAGSEPPISEKPNGSASTDYVQKVAGRVSHMAQMESTYDGRGEGVRIDFREIARAATRTYSQYGKHQGTGDEMSFPRSAD